MAGGVYTMHIKFAHNLYTIRKRAHTHKLTATEKNRTYNGVGKGDDMGDILPPPLTPHI